MYLYLCLHLQHSVGSLLFRLLLAGGLLQLVDPALGHLIIGMKRKPCSYNFKVNYTDMMSDLLKSASLAYKLDYRFIMISLPVCPFAPTPVRVRGRRTGILPPIHPRAASLSSPRSGPNNRWRCEIESFALYRQMALPGGRGSWRGGSRRAPPSAAAGTCHRPRASRSPSPANVMMLQEGHSRISMNK